MSIEDQIASRLAKVAKAMYADSHVGDAANYASTELKAKVPNQPRVGRTNSRPNRELTYTTKNFDGNDGEIAFDKFTATNGAYLTAERNKCNSVEADVPAIDGYVLSVSGFVTPGALRELAAEMLMLADHIDGAESMIAIGVEVSGGEPVVAELSPRQKAARKAAKTRKRNQKLRTKAVASKSKGKK